VSRVPFAYAACALIWGTTWYGIRVCLEGYPTFTALALRFLVATCVLVPLALRVGPWPRGKAWVYLVIAGVLDAGSYLLVYIGEERVPGGVAAVLYGTQPLILAVLLAATRMEPITRRHIVGAVVSLAGVVVLAWDRFEVSPQQALGVVLVLGSVLVSTIYSMVMKRHSELLRAFDVGGGRATQVGYVLGIVALAVVIRFVPGDRRVLAALIGVSLLATPILWPHYLVLLFVPVALASPRLTRVWVVPLLLWVNPTAWSTGHAWQIAGELGLALVGLSVVLRLPTPRLPRLAPA